ncbi:quinone oxidoreductase family protein [Kribbella sp. CA-293567]|uniref:quinone oxidoreductase family protein n=1 Tax=Kribbella sp. CA-293567 TaxID=3002436 RepID=UPI0022DCF22D|nr:quinone oxidoreductase [Kribbella sp. CA-293567]WBQ04359.1 quinone oxidoreductase [Kribbella sp. CA-293567]
MKAFQVTAPGEARVVEMASRPLKAAEARVKVVAAGINYLDLQGWTGGVGPQEYPWIPGGEGSGVVVETGAHAIGVAVGDRVCWQGVLGSYADEVVAPADRLIPIPEHLTFDEAAAVLLQGLTAQYLSADAYRIRPKDLVVVHAGAGGVGMLLTGFAKSMGATVITTVSTDAKAMLSLEAGADESVPYADLVEIAKLRAAAVYDSVGLATFEQSLCCLALRGTLVLYGQSSGAVPPFDLGRLGPAGSLIVTRPTLRHFVRSRAELLARADDLFSRVARSEVRIRFGGVYPLAEAPQVLDALRSRFTTGKLILQP